MRKWTKHKLGLALLLVLLLVAGGCSSQTDSVIETVLNQQFSGPDEELIALLEDPENLAIIGDDEQKRAPSSTDLEDYLQETYGSLIIENSYQEIVSNAVHIQTAAAENNYSLKAEDFQLNQSDANEKEYDFSFDVVYEGNENSGEQEISGKAFVNENDKIADIRFDESLQSLLNALE
ncbi:hypothetical protein [Aureibacillus halotolerans]|uniref:Lipoprotein n=1 Tax=Aureibacillus halotolerans TaxID=1508390 RepID=A0A4R6TU27_9BACI|nr:hypothetical protein [Aureibacillus halotolerans]TDQ34588.1 hypothetical protein EV213_1246 [Aureibacillus halotolerans]